MGRASETALVKFGTPARPVESTPIIPITPAKLVNNLADRVELIVVNAGTDLVTIGLSHTLVAGVGIRLAPGGTVDILADEDGDVVGYEWWAVASTASQQLYVLEVIAE